ncbi:MAG: InlB B-repeat-containing protein [Clostridia bacterium]|nr:InlB B-repeat-containing protein [Clostridia bacterium]
MREYECKICGATAILKPDGNYQCAYCKQKYTIEQLIDKNPHVDLSFSVRLQMIRKAMEEDYDFPEAMKLCLEMAREYPEQQQLLWFSLLAENRITYIKNGEGRFVPTFLDPEKDSLQNSRYYKKLNEHYRTEADQIERMRLETATEFRKSKPYDVFISYKQHDENGNDTEEKTWADDLYNFLTGKHLRVFLDHFVMDKNNAGWEPQIYAAIRSAKHVIVIGSSVENINSPFVKNEWKRALAFCKCGEEKNVITMCTRSMVELLDPELTKKQIVFSDSGERNASIYNRVNTADPWHDFLAQNGCADEEEFVSKKKLVVFDKDQFRTAVLFGSPEDRAMHFDATFRRIKRQNDIDLLEEYAMLDVAKMDVLQLSESMFERAKKKNSKAIYSSVISIVRHYDEGMANRMEYEWKAHLVHAGKVKRIKAIVAAVAAVAIAIGLFIGYRQIDRYEPLKTAESGASVSVSSDAFSIAKKFMVRFDSVEIRSDASEFSTYAEAMYAQSQNIAVYDLTFLLFGEQVEPKDDVTVTMPIPASLRGKNVDVYYINDSMECIKIDSEISKEHATISFTTNHFSIYVLAETPYAVSFVSNNGKEIPVQNVNHGKFAAEPQTILKTGYTFGGWYDADGHAWAFDADPIVEDTVLYAKWNANTYQVTYALEEMGVITGESSTSKVTFDADYRLLVPVDTAGKYTFEGWYTVAGEQLTDGEGNAFSPWSIAQNATVHAKWRRIVLTVTLDAGAGTNSGTYVVNKGDSLLLPVSARTGYDFVGWLDNTTNQTYKGEFVPASSLNLSAKWKAHTYTVIFNTQGGEVSKTSMTVTYGSSFSFPVPTKEYDVFTGWYTSSGRTLTDDNGYSVNIWNIANQETNTSLYVYAKWLPVNVIDLETTTAGTILINSTMGGVYLKGSSGKTYSGFNIAIGSGNYSAHVYLEDAHLVSDDSNAVIYSTASRAVVLISVGTSNSLTAQSGLNAIDVDALTIQGISDLTIKAGNGVSSSGAGASGNMGGIGISADKVTVKLGASLTVYGGNGSDGVAGAGYSVKDYGSGYRHGFDGGAGGAGGSAIECNTIEFLAATTFVAIGGQGGTGGNGGNGGGSNADGTSCGGNGGNGGSGGAGGSSVIAKTSFYNPSFGAYVTLRSGAGGAGGAGGDGGYGQDANRRDSGGAGGTGGAGGNSGYTLYTKSTTSSSSLIAICGSGGNGGAGGIGGNAYDDYSVSATCGNGGNGGNGGNSLISYGVSTTKLQLTYGTGGNGGAGGSAGNTSWGAALYEPHKGTSGTGGTGGNIVVNGNTIYTGSAGGTGSTGYGSSGGSGGSGACAG